MKIGIIGFGSFGQFMAKHLKDRAEVVVTNTSNKEKEAKRIGVKFLPLDEAIKSDVVILSVPIEKMKDVLHSIKDKLNPGTLVLDVCSVKIFPCELMKKNLPDNVEIIGTHPLFGPESAKNSLKGMKIALCNVRSKRVEKVRKFCEGLGLTVFEVSPEEHDREMAVSQALTHFVGRVFEKMDLKKVGLGTKTFDDLVDISNIIKNDSRALFENIETKNPFAGELRKRFIEESKKLDDHLDGIDDK